MEIDGREAWDRTVDGDGPVIDLLMELAAVDEGLLLRQTVTAVLGKDRGRGCPPRPLLDALASWSGDPASAEFEVFADYMYTDEALTRETARIARQPLRGGPATGQPQARQAAFVLHRCLPELRLSAALDEAAAGLPRLREFLLEYAPEESPTPA